MVEDPSNSRDKDKKQRSSYYDASEPSSSRRHRRRHNRRDRDSEKESLPEKSLSPAKPRPTHHHSSDSSYSQSRSELPRSESSDGVSHLLKKERMSDRPTKGKKRIKNHSPKHLNPRFKKTLLYEAFSSSEFLSCDEDDSVSDDDDVSGKKNVLVYHKSESEVSKNKSEFAFHLQSEWLNTRLCVKRTSYTEVRSGTSYSHEGKERIKNHSPEHLNHRSKEKLLYQASSSSEFLSCDEDDSVSDDDVSGKKNELVHHKSESEVSKNQSEFAFHLQSEWLNTELCMKRSSYTQVRSGTSYSHEVHDAHLRRLYRSLPIYEQSREAMDRLIQRNQSLEKENKLVRKNMKLERENKRVRRRLITYWVVAVILVVSLSVLSFRRC